MGRQRAERVAITCRTCGTEFRERASKRRQYCSRACAGKSFAARYAADRVELTCQHCGAPFVVRPGLADAEYCSLVCRQTAVSRKTAAARSAKLRGKGTGPNGGLKPTTYPKLHGRHLHRVIAERKIGRPLQTGEVVHHDDENKHNNEPGNLEVLPSQAEHARLHGRKRNRKGKAQ